MPAPSVLLVHNRYQRPGGEDVVVRAEAALLRARGHVLHEYLQHNARIDDMGKGRLLKATVWNAGAHRGISDALEASGSQVAHFHNTFPLISPAGYYAARRRRVGVVQTLHNYRLLCPSSVFLRDGRLCQDCLGKTVPWPGVLHGCYRESRAATAVVAGMLAVHRAMGTYANAVDVYIALTEFARRTFIAGGLPEDRVVVKPNFTEDPGIGAHKDNTVLFVGRLTQEKGVDDLLDAWRLFVEQRPTWRLQVVGDGPLGTRKGEGPAGVEWLGWQARDEVTRMMQDAAVLVVPSTHREGLPMAIVEAYATGLPVLAGGFEAMTELVQDGRTGRLYQRADPRDLAEVLGWMIDDAETHRALCRGARAEYDAKYSPARHYDQLTRIYEVAIDRATHRSRVTHTPARSAGVEAHGPD